MAQPLVSETKPGVFLTEDGKNVGLGAVCPLHGLLLHVAAGRLFRNGAFFVNEKGATTLLSAFGFVLFLIGRFVGTYFTRKHPAHLVLGWFASANTILMFVIFVKIGWVSCIALFLSFFFMSIMFPTIFALGISGLGEKSKTASLFIVPLFCFAFVAFYAFSWRKLVKPLQGNDVILEPQVDLASP